LLRLLQIEGSLRAIARVGLGVDRGQRQRRPVGDLDGVHARDHRDVALLHRLLMHVAELLGGQIPVELVQRPAGAGPQSLQVALAQRRGVVPDRGPHIVLRCRPATDQRHRQPDQRQHEHHARRAHRQQPASRMPARRHRFGSPLRRGWHPLRLGQLARLVHRLRGTGRVVVGGGGRARRLRDRCAGADPLRSGPAGDLRALARALWSGLAGDLRALARALWSGLAGDLRALARALWSGLAGDLRALARALWSSLTGGLRALSRTLWSGLTGDLWSGRPRPLLSGAEWRSLPGATLRSTRMRPASAGDRRPAWPLRSGLTGPGRLAGDGALG